MKGLFLTVEGIEGSGKTTQLQRLAEAIRATGRSVVVTKEPGGTQLSDRVRAILLDPNEEGMDPITELLLYAASRRQHVVEIIEPALRAGSVVLSDRFTDATLAYQGFGRTLNFDHIRQLNAMATGGREPDLTIIFDLPEQEGLDRAKRRNLTSQQSQNESRLEGEDLRFHRRVREGYLSLATARPARYLVVDARGGIDEIAAATRKQISERFPTLLGGEAGVAR